VFGIDYFFLYLPEKMKIFIPTFFVTFFISVVMLFGQEQISADQRARTDYFKESGPFSILYTGRIPDVYPNLPFKEPPFLYSYDFIIGNLSYNGRLYENVFLNLNVHKNQLYVSQTEKANQQQIIELDPLLVDFFTFKKEKFIYYNVQEYKAVAPPGYYAYLLEGEFSLLRNTSKTFNEKLDKETQKVVYNFIPKETYILIHNGIPYKLTGKKSLLTLLNKHPKEMRTFIRNARLRFNTSSPEIGDSYLLYVTYYETINK